MENYKMKIAVIGTGYVGLPTGVGLAELGHQVVCIDREQSKIDNLREGKITLFEAGLEDLFLKNIKADRIIFTTSMEEGVRDADIVIIAVGTPPHPIAKEADMKYIHAAATELAPHLKKYTIVAIKSTVPIGTGDDVEYLIQKTNQNAECDVVSLPEFLREGFAVYDFFNPDRIVVGANTEKAKEKIREMYTNFEGKCPLLFVQRRSSETIKYASNAFLAMKIHYINEMADFCEKTGADIQEVAQGMGLDSRIGDKFLRPGPGYGGSCFPKDTQALTYMARQNEVELTLVQATIKGNAKRKEEIAERIMLQVKGIEKPRIGILGLAFKDGTDDCRESPAMEIIGHLLERKVEIKAYDPEAMENAKELLNDKIQYASSMDEVAENADVLVVLTEWKDFKELNLKHCASVMHEKKILDFRNILDKNKAEELGFVFNGIG